MKDARNEFFPYGFSYFFLLSEHLFGKFSSSAFDVTIQPVRLGLQFALTVRVGLCCERSMNSPEIVHWCLSCNLVAEPLIC